MANEEDYKKAAKVTSLAVMRALTAILGYDPVRLGPIEDILADEAIEEGLKQNKKLKDIVEESGRSLSTVKRRRDEWLGITDKEPEK
jgi:hypothetical protein